MHRRWLSLVLALCAFACSDIPTNHDTAEWCGCVKEPVRLAPVGSPIDTATTVEPCRTFSLAVSAIGDRPASRCSMPMTCPIGERTPYTGVNVQRAVDHPDVQTALRAGIDRYGAGPGVADAGAPLYRISVGQVAFEVGGPCGAAPCTPVPEGVRALLDVLLAVNEQEIRRSPCREMLQL